MDNYDINSIESLSFKDGVRMRIPMYLGTDDTEGIYQALKEVVNNSTDEALMGFGNKIIITVNEEENFISVVDEGRGCPFGIRENGENVLVSIFSKGHTGGKFNNKSYTMASGLNGIGVKATCLSSEKFEAQSVRDGKMATVYFEKGELINYREGETKLPNGTYIRFKPDKEVFKNMNDGFTYKRVCSEIQNVAYLNRGIHFIVINDTTNEKKEFYSENGIADFIMEKAKKPLMKKPIIALKKDETDEVEVAFIWTGGNEQSYVFVNGLFCSDGGAPVTGAKTALTSTIKKKSGCDLDADLIRKGLIYAINCKVSNPSFSNQTKNKINNPNLRTLASQAFKEGLEEFFNSPESATIIEMIKKFQKAEKAADRAREAILSQHKEIEKELKKKIVLAEKLVDCKKHDENSMLFIVEGKSAKGAIVKARNAETTACFDLRGKLINALKNDEEKLAKNEEVKQLHIALGCGYGEKFNIKKLRYGKIVLVADMDKDGFAINCLILTFLYYFYPQLIEAGKVYWGATPLYKVETSNKNYYAYNEKELKDLPKGDLTRLKGLGESTPQDFRDTICSKTPRLIQFTMNDAAAAAKYFDILLGENIEERKKYIFENANFENLDD